ncbi:hypothetical protein DdX_09246 [Ditylenchus destructor]|uniref:Uncharacterized protein n=1 Tax=Ditylenchus destructor TaxID=166010 RepID=A0AAD4N6D3_9BILA|nr:hypothetical protein DdX_09246 [Ditylenchus destructor]
MYQNYRTIHFGCPTDSLDAELIVVWVINGLANCLTNGNLLNTHSPSEERQETKRIQIPLNAIHRKRRSIKNISAITLTGMMQSCFRPIKLADMISLKLYLFDERVFQRDVKSSMSVSTLFKKVAESWLQQYSANDLYLVTDIMTVLQFYALTKCITKLQEGLRVVDFDRYVAAFRRAALRDTVSDRFEGMFSLLSTYYLTGATEVSNSLSGQRLVIQPMKFVDKDVNGVVLGGHVVLIVWSPEEPLSVYVYDASYNITNGSLDWKGVVCY